MSQEKDDEDEEETWLGTICYGGEKCLRSGYWEQAETKYTVWHEVGDFFPPLQDRPYTSYKYLGKKK